MRLSGPFMFIGAVLGGAIDCVVLGIPHLVVTSVRKVRRRRRRRVWEREKLKNAIYHSNRMRFGNHTAEFRRACVSELRANGFEPPAEWVEAKN